MKSRLEIDEILSDEGLEPTCIIRKPVFVNRHLGRCVSGQTGLCGIICTWVVHKSFDVERGLVIRRPIRCSLPGSAASEQRPRR